jgi:hypothetical protein
MYFEIHTPILLFFNKKDMSHLKVINASQGYIHKYENLKNWISYTYNANI